MKPLNRDHSILEHIVSYCEQIEATIDRFGDSYAVFSEDPIYRNAAALCILGVKQPPRQRTGNRYAAGWLYLVYYDIPSLRNRQAMHIHRAVQRDRQIDQRERAVAAPLLKIINDLPNDAIIRQSSQGNNAVPVLVSIGRIRRWTPNIENVEIPVIVDCYV